MFCWGRNGEHVAKQLSFLILCSWLALWIHHRSLLLSTDRAQNPSHHSVFGGTIPLGALEVTGSFSGGCMHSQANATHGWWVSFHLVVSFWAFYWTLSWGQMASYDVFLCCRNYRNSRWLNFSFCLWASVGSGMELGWSFCLTGFLLWRLSERCGVKCLHCAWHIVDD